MYIGLHLPVMTTASLRNHGDQYSPMKLKQQSKTAAFSHPRQALTHCLAMFTTYNLQYTVQESRAVAGKPRDAEINLEAECVVCIGTYAIRDCNRGIHYHNPYPMSDNGVHSIGWRLVINIHDVQHSITARQACFTSLFKTQLPTAALAVNYEVVGLRLDYRDYFFTFQSSFDSLW